MITMTLVNIFLYVSVNLYGATGEVDWSTLSSGQIEEYLQLQEANRRNSDLDNLKTAKDFLINGNTKMARFHLEQINLKNSPVKLIRNRYMSLIEFIEGNYRQSLNLIKSGRYDDEPRYDAARYSVPRRRYAGAASSDDGLPRCSSDDAPERYAEGWAPSPDSHPGYSRARPKGE